jgi:hypothetical protein
VNYGHAVYISVDFVGCVCVYNIDEVFVMKPYNHISIFIYERPSELILKMVESK